MRLVPISEALDPLSDDVGALQKQTYVVADRAAIAVQEISAERFFTLDGMAWVAGGPSGPLATQDSSGAWFQVSPGLLPSVREFGTSSDWGAAATAARAASNDGFVVIERPKDAGFASYVARSAYGGANTSFALGFSFQAGSSVSPTVTFEPVVMIEKAVANNLNPSGPVWERAFEVTTQRVGGTGRSIAITGYARDVFGGTEAIGIHGRAEATDGATANALFGGWSAAALRASATAASVIGHEIDITNQVADRGWQSRPSSSGRDIGLILNNDGTDSFPGTAAIWLVRSTKGQDPTTEGGWWTGFLIDKNAIVAEDGSGNAEAIRVRGGSTVGNRYGGMALGDSGDADPDNFSYGIRMKDAAFANNAAVWFAYNHQITFGPDKATGRYISILDDDRLILGGGDQASRAVWPIIPAKTTAPTLSQNGQISVAAVSDTTLRFYYRGSDGVTRTFTLGAD